jgi:hypothetical protein
MTARATVMGTAKSKPACQLETLRVVGYDYAVRYSDHKTRRGLSDPQSQIITIGSSLPLDQLGEVLLHETMHAIDDALNLELSEVQVKGLARGFWAVLKDNPTFAGTLEALVTVRQARAQKRKGV